MKVLWFSTTPSLGGARLGRSNAGGGWIRSLEQQVRDHVELSVAFYHEQGAAPYRQDGTTYYALPRARHHLVGKAVSRLTDALETDDDVLRLADLVTDVGPDVVHVHGTEGPFGLVQRHTTVPTLTSVQGVLSAVELKYFSGLDRRSARRHAGPRELALRNSYADRYRVLAKQAEREREMLRISRHLTGRTDWDRRVLSVLAPEATYDHLDEILRPPFYDARWEPHDHPKLELFTTTGPNLYKGLETLLRCAALLDDLGVDYRWSVAGLAAGDPFVELFRRALGTPWPPRVQLLGTLGETALVERMLASDLFVGVSHSENSPNSLCEAQLLGLPSVTTYAGGTASLVTDDVDGVLVQDGDPYALAGAVVELRDDPARAAALGARARERAGQRHDPARITERVLELYRGLVSSP